MHNNATKFVEQGLTYDDVLLVPAYSETLPREVDITTKFSRNMAMSTIGIGLMLRISRLRTSLRNQINL